MKIIHYEIPVKDIDKSLGFYKQLLGWKLKNKKENYCFLTSDNQEISIGLEKLKPPIIYPICYVLVNSLEKSLKKAQALGGKVLIHKTKFAQDGFYAIISDINGNNLGLWERLKK